MWKDACLVELRWPGNTDNAADTSSSSSGIWIPNEAFVLTHASILLPYVTSHPATLKDLKRHSHLTSRHLSELESRITIERNPPDRRLAAGLVHGSQSFATSMLKVPSPQKVDEASDRGSRRTTRTFPGRVDLVWKSEHLAKTLDRLFSASEGWSFYEAPDDEGGGKKSTSTEAQTISDLMPYFILIRVNKNQFQHSTRSDSQFSPRIYRHRPRQGLRVSVAGTPFGALSPKVFLNSVSQGIVCNTAGPDGLLLLTDARCIPGTEGAPLYVEDATSGHAAVAGMILSALCWKTNEWIGMALACSMREVASSLRARAADLVLEPGPGQADTTRGMDLSPLDGALAVDVFRPHGVDDQLPVVFVQNGATWGSGLLLVHGRTTLVLTCAHVVQHQQPVQIRVRSGGPGGELRWYDAVPVYSNQVGQVYDLAVLTVPGLKPTAQWPPPCRPRLHCDEGEEVYVVGHAMFGQAHRMEPSVTSGVISKVIRVKGQPVMLQSTCSVNAGASGGPLVDTRGRVLGIVTCNAKDTAAGACYPHINMSIPMSAIWPSLVKYTHTQDGDALRSLRVTDEGISSVWRLSEDDASPPKSKL